MNSRRTQSPHTHTHTHKECSNLLLSGFIIILLICILLTTTLGILYVKKFTPQKLLTKVGIKAEDATDWSLLSWNSSLEQLDYDADAVFIGDSITRGENFQERFPEKKLSILDYLAIRYQESQRGRMLSAILHQK